MSRRIFLITSGIVILGALYYIHPMFLGLYRDLAGREEHDQSLPVGVLLPEAGTNNLRLGVLPKGFPRTLVSPRALRGITAKDITTLGGLQQQAVTYRVPLPINELELFYLEVFRTQGFTLGMRTSQERYATLQTSRGLESVHVVLTAVSDRETKASIVYEKVK